MTAAHAMPADDPGALRAAVERAAAGEVIRLLDRDGSPLADVTPPGEGSERKDQDDQAADRVTREFLQQTGAVPTLEDYRRVYAAADVPWPGDEHVLRLHPVASQ